MAFARFVNIHEFSQILPGGEQIFEVSAVARKITTKYWSHFLFGNFDVKDESKIEILSFKCWLLIRNFYNSPAISLDQSVSMYSMVS